MVTTTNKGYEKQVTGTNSGTWGDVLNASVFDIVDRNLGGSVTKSLTNLNVALNATESQNLRLILNGTLTGNVLVETLAVGLTIVQNDCTGNFTVTFRKASVGTAVAIPNGTIVLVATDAAASPKPVGVDFPTGTRLPFQQTTPPAGYTKDTVTAGLNNSMFRCVTGTVGSGGSQGVTTVFTSSRTPSGNVGDTALSVGQMPSHEHFVVNSDFNPTTGTGLNSGTYVEFGAGGAGSAAYSMSGNGTVANIGRSSAQGSGQTHGHSLSMNAMNFDVLYTDFSIGVKV